MREISYDAAGNRTKLLSSAGEVGYAYEPNSNRMISSGRVAQTLDASGNVLSTGGLAFTYNGENRVSTAFNSERSATYRYNFRGERVRKVVAGDISIDSRYVYGQHGELLGEYDGVGNRIQEFVYRYDGSAPEPVAQIDADGTIIYLHTDHLFTPRLATGGDKGVVWRWMSNAFGEGAPSEDADGDGVVTVVHLRLPGQYCDVESGVYYNYYRSYDPAVGRYLQSDPLGVEPDINTYAFVRSRPLSKYDIYGLAWGNAEATWHFYFGGGNTVALSKTGHVGAVTGQIAQKLSQWKTDVEVSARSRASAMPCNSGSGMFMSQTRGAHSGVWWIGGFSLAQSADCSVSTNCTKGACPPLDRKNFRYTCQLEFGMHDLFVNPSDLDNSGGGPNADFWDEWQYGGTPFHVDHTWSESIFGSGEI